MTTAMRGDDDASSSPAPDASRREPDDSDPRCSPDPRKRVTISPALKRRIVTTRVDMSLDYDGRKWHFQLGIGG